MKVPASSGRVVVNATLILLGVMCNHGDAIAKEFSGNRWAILIGVNDYIQAQDLKYCVADQNELQKRLVASGFPSDQVFVLRDGASEPKYLPTKRNIETQLELILGLVERDDVVILSFSGHGYSIDGKSYLAPNDADLRDAETLIELDKVYELLKFCPASLKLMLVDACRNDPHLGGQRSLEATKESSKLAESFQEATPEGIVLLNSCSPGEISWEEEDWGHGVFMHHVLEGLEGKADRDRDGMVSINELAMYAKRGTKVHVARKYNHSQRPFMKNESTLEAFDFGFRTGQSGPQQTITNSIGMTLKLIPAGTFEMGSRLSPEEVEKRFKKFGAEAKYYTNEHPLHRVTITRPFYLGEHEVTVGQFQQFTSATGYKTEAETDEKGGWGYNEKEGKLEQGTLYNWLNTGWSQSDSHPVVNVTWNDAQAFCHWLSGKEKAKYRLPTEAEWEYSCRAGTKSLYYNGDDPEGLASVGNVFDGTAKSKFTSAAAITARDGYVFTAPVGRFRANAFGLLDMHGNVCELCQDYFGEYGSSPTNDPVGPDSGLFRVIRGGSWFFITQDWRSANRVRNMPESRYDSLGFRVLRSSVE